MEKFKLLINGEDVDTGVYGYFPYADKIITEYATVSNIIKELRRGALPDNADDYVYAKYCVGDEKNNCAAIESAHEAFKKFREFPLSARRKIFLDMYRLLLKNKEQFIRLLNIEGHPPILAEWEFEGMRIGSSPKTIKYYCKYIYRKIGQYKKESLYLARRPDGVVCINTPGNASASSSYNGILALLVGNTVVIKPPLQTPTSTIFLWREIVHRALTQNNAPAGTVNIITGNSRSTLNAWLVSEHVNDIMHFGTSRDGLEIGARIYSAGKKPILELSGNDILIVWRDADIEKASDSLLDCFFGSTQVCMVPKIALVHQDVYEKFICVFLEKVKGLRSGIPSAQDSILSPVIRINDFYKFMNDAIEKGGTLLYGGERINHLNEIDINGMYIRPALIQIDDYEKSLDMQCVKEEIFFPLLPLIRVVGNDDGIFTKMVDFVNSHNYGIRCSAWGSSPKYLQGFIDMLSNCGMLRINSRHIGFSYYLSTHGGTKRSGGPFGEMNYFWQKTSHLQGVCREVK